VDGFFYGELFGTKIQSCVTSLGFQPMVWACLPMQAPLAPTMLPWSLAGSSAPLYLSFKLS